MNDATQQYEPVKLTNALLRSWYGKTLVAPASTSVAPQVQVEEPPRASVSVPRHEVLVFLRPLPAAQREQGMKFLSDILRACKLSLDGVALFEGPGPGDLDTLRTTCNPKAMILFGIDPAATGLPLHFPHFQPAQHGGIKLLSAPAIEDLYDDKQAKGKLWNGLKNIFGL